MHGSRHHPHGELTCASDIDDLDVVGQPCVVLAGIEPAGPADLVLVPDQVVLDIRHIPEHGVVADPGQAHGDRLLLALGSHDDDRLVRSDDHAHGFGHPAVVRDADRAGQMTGREIQGGPGVVDHRAGSQGVGDLPVGQCGDLGTRLANPPLLLVEGCVVEEVGRSRGLALGHHGEELVLRHRLAGVVDPALLADRRLLLGREVLAAGRARAVRREDPHCVGQPHEHGVDRVVELAAEFVGRGAD